MSSLKVWIKKRLYPFYFLHYFLNCKPTKRVKSLTTHELISSFPDTSYASFSFLQYNYFSPYQLKMKQVRPKFWWTFSQIMWITADNIKIRKKYKKSFLSKKAYLLGSFLYYIYIYIYVCVCVWVLYTYVVYISYIFLVYIYIYIYIYICFLIIIIIKLFTKNEKELENLIRTVRIYSQGIGMEFAIKKCVMLIIESG